MTDESRQVRTRQEPFDQVPCWIRTLGLHAYTTYAALVNIERVAGCFPSVATLASVAMLSERSTRAALRTLEQAGAIRTEQSKGRQTSTYHLLAFASNPAAGAESTRQDVPSSTRQDVPPISDEGLSSQTEPPSGGSDSSVIAKDAPGFHPVADVLCVQLAGCVAAVTDQLEVGVPHAWRREARLMLDGPGSKPPEWTVDQISYAIRWLEAGASRDAAFWRTNILSMPTLREKMPRLCAAIKAEKARIPTAVHVPAFTDRAAAAAAQIERLEARERANA